MRSRSAIFAFNGGELSRRMEGRSDLDGIYDRAVAQMLNFVATVEGPATKRPGFRYIKPSPVTASWLIPFIFNTTQAYVLEWSDQAVRFYTNGGQIETAPGVPYELAVPYTAEQAKRLSIRQSFDRLYLAHPDFPPAMITRIEAEEFSYQVIPLTNGPFKDWNTGATSTIVWSGTGDVGASATVTAAKQIFEIGHIGAPFIFEVKDFANVKAWEPLVKLDTIALGDLRRSDGKIYKLIQKAGTYTGNIEPTHTEGQEWDGSGNIIYGQSTTTDTSGALWEYVHDRFGAGEITAVASPTQATLRVTRRLPEVTKTEATHHWAHGAFSDVEGWPQLVDRWAQRLLFWKGVDLAGSVVGDYFNFSPVDESGIFAPDMAFRLRLDTADPPMWTHADKEYLLAGSASAELVVTQINHSAGLSADNLRADPQSSYGSAECWPVSIGTGTLFVQRGGRKIREAVFDYNEERFVGANITIYARHITRSGISWLAFQQEPETMLWGGRSDGTLIAHPHNPEQQVKGFARVELAAGTVLSGVTIPSDDGTKDELWILAELDGARCVMTLSDWWDEDAGLARSDAFFLDYGVSYAGAPLATFTTGLDHLEGRQVRILADGIEYNGAAYTVTGGSVTLPQPASAVHIGLGYQAKLKLLRPEVRAAGSIAGLRNRLVKLLARLIDTASLIVRDKNGETDSMLERPTSTPLNTPPALFSGDTRNTAAGTSSSYEITDTIENDDALPCTIAQLLPTYDVEEAPAP